MKKTSKAILMVAALAAATSAHAAVPSGDVVLGFTSGSGSDYLFTVGPVTSLVDGETWTTVQGFNDPNTASVFGAVGYQNGTTAQTKLIYSTFATPTGGPSEPLNGFNTVKANVTTIPAAATVNTGASVLSSSTTSWFSQTDQAPGTPGNTFQNNMGGDNPNVSVSSLAYLYSTDNNADPASLIGDFRVSSDGSTLTFDAAPIPEPTAYGLLAGFGLLALSLRRQIARLA